MTPRKDWMAPAQRTTTAATKSVAIWIRVSTEDQARGESPEIHERRARGYAETRGWNVVTVYDLSGVSGKTVMGHVQAKQMMSDVASGKITGLIFSKLARLARNTVELLEFAAYFQKHGADLISLAESIDTSTPAGRLFYTMVAATAQFEREEIVDRLTASIKTRAKMGKPLSSVPFGYRRVDGRVELHPEEAPVRRLAYELFREHKRLKRVADLLNKAGHRTRRGNKWDGSSVITILRGTAAKGTHRINYTKSDGKGGKSWEFKPESEWVWITVPAIVSEALWTECNAMLELRKTGKRPSRRVAHLFAGVAFCNCGQKMYVPSNMPKYYCRACHAKIPVEDLEKAFVARLRDFYFDAEEIAAHLAQAGQELADRQARLTALARERDRVKAESDKLYRLYLDDQLTPEGFGARHRPLEERLGQLAAEVPRLQGEIDCLEIEQASSATVVADAQDLYGRWASLSFDERRQVVEAILEKITVGNGEIVIEMAFLPPSPQIVAGRESSHSASRARRSGTGPARA